MRKECDADTPDCNRYSSATSHLWWLLPVLYTLSSTLALLVKTCTNGSGLDQ